MDNVIVPRYPYSVNDLDGDLFNPPLRHGCLGCGEYVTPDADGTIPGLCEPCAARPVTPECPICGMDSAPALHGKGWTCWGERRHTFRHAPIVQATAEADLYTCGSFTDARTYDVDLRFRFPRCSCPDSTRHAHIHGYTCKHGLFTVAAVVAGTVQPAPVVAPVATPARPKIAASVALDDCFATKAERRVA